MGIAMNIGMKSFGLVAVMGLVGCAGELSDETTGRTAQALETTATSGHARDINIEICEGEQPTLDPVFAAWADGALNQDASSPSVTFGSVTGGRAVPVAVHPDAVIKEMELHTRSKEPAHLTLRIVEPIATSTAPVWVTCAFPVRAPVDEYRFVATDDAGNTILDTSRPVALGAMHVAIDASGAQTGTFELTLNARDAEAFARATKLRGTIEGIPAVHDTGDTEGVAGRANRVSARIEKLPGSVDHESEASLEKVIGNVTPTDTTRIGELKVRGIALLQGTTPSYVVSARLSGLRRITAATDSDVVATFAIDNASPDSTGLTR